jgi:hypothetical protein
MKPATTAGKTPAEHLRRPRPFTFGLVELPGQPGSEVPQSVQREHDGEEPCCTQRGETR